MKSFSDIYVDIKGVDRSAVYGYNFLYEDDFITKPSQNSTIPTISFPGEYWNSDL